MAPMPAKAQRDMTPNEIKAAFATGVAPPRMTMPNITTTRAARPSQASQQTSTASSVHAGVQNGPRPMKPLDPSTIGDPMNMTVSEITNLKYGTHVKALVQDIPVPEGEKPTYVVAAETASAKLLVAFSEKAREDLAGTFSAKPKQLVLGLIPVLSVKRLISYLGGVCTPPENAKEPQMNIIYAKNLPEDVWLGIWKCAEDLKMPHVLNQLIKQTRGDLKDETPGSTSRLLGEVRKQGIKSLEYGLTGRLWALAKKSEPGFELTLAGVEAMMAVAPNEKFTKVAITNLAEKLQNPLNKDDTSSIEGASDALKTAILDKWEYFHYKEVQKVQRRADTIADRRDREAREIVGWDNQTGKPKRYYLS